MPIPFIIWGAAALVSTAVTYAGVTNHIDNVEKKKQDEERIALERERLRIERGRMELERRRQDR